MLLVVPVILVSVVYGLFTPEFVFDGIRYRKCYTPICKMKANAELLRNSQNLNQLMYTGNQMNYANVPNFSTRASIYAANPSIYNRLPFNPLNQLLSSPCMMAPQQPPLYPPPPYYNSPPPLPPQNFYPPPPPPRYGFEPGYRGYENAPPFRPPMYRPLPPPRPPYYPPSHFDYRRRSFDYPPPNPDYRNPRFDPATARMYRRRYRTETGFGGAIRETARRIGSTIGEGVRRFGDRIVGMGDRNWSH